MKRIRQPSWLCVVAALMTVGCSHAPQGVQTQKNVQPTPGFYLNYTFYSSRNDLPWTRYPTHTKRVSASRRLSVAHSLSQVTIPLVIDDAVSCSKAVTKPDMDVKYCRHSMVAPSIHITDATLTHGVWVIHGKFVNQAGRSATALDGLLPSTVTLDSHDKLWKAGQDVKPFVITSVDTLPQKLDGFTQNKLVLTISRPPVDETVQQNKALSQVQP